MDVTGIDNHEMNGLQMVDAGAYIETNLGPRILVMRQYAYHGINRTIHSSLQLEHYKNKVDDKSIKAGGRQCITTPDNVVIPLDIINGLPYMKMRPYTDEEAATIPAVILTSSDNWDPSVFDFSLTDKSDWIETIGDLKDGTWESPFDEFGKYKEREPISAPPVRETIPIPTEAQHERPHWNVR